SPDTGGQGALSALAVEPCGWVDPVAVAAGIRRREGALGLIAGADDPAAHGGRMSFVACEPDLCVIWPVRDAAPFQALRNPAFAGGGVGGLMSYDAGARPATGDRGGDWPDLMLARYPGRMAFARQVK